MSENSVEKISELEIACKILNEVGKDNPMFYKTLIKEVLRAENKSVQNEALAISEIYTMMNMDSRFQHLGEGYWGLTEWNPPEVKRGRGGRKTIAKQSDRIADE